MNNTILIFGFEIYWYAIIITTGLLTGIILARREWKKSGMEIKLFDDILFSTIIFSFIGARIWYILFSGNLESYISDPFSIINLRDGGMAIHGGILAGMMVLIFYARKKKLILLEITDIAVISLILGQAIGRWGNFVNQEAHGGETSLFFLKETLHLPKFIIEGMNINGIYYHPTFLYESLWNILGFILLIIIRKTRKTSYGFLTGFYLMWYGLARIIIESMRTDALLLGNIKIAQLSSIIMLIVGIIIMIITFKRRINEKNSN